VARALPGRHSTGAFEILGVDEFARHVAGATRDHGIPDALAAGDVTAFADTAYRGVGPTIPGPVAQDQVRPSRPKFIRTNFPQVIPEGTGPVKRCADRFLFFFGDC
jgi:hypothetical protein